jgi:predicted phage-related endonuclease
MSYQNIDATVSDSDLHAVKDAFAVVLDKLPFLVNLTASERQGIAKTGGDSVSFVQNALAAAKGNPEVFPASFDTAGFQRDVELFATLTELHTQAKSVASQLDDTRMAVGGEAMQAATQTYQYIKTAAKTTPGLKPAADQLGERFQRATKQKASGNPPTPGNKP